MDTTQLKAAQKAAGGALAQTTNSIKDSERASEQVKAALRDSLEASLPKSRNGWYDVPSMLHSFRGIFDGPVFPDTEKHVKYMDLLNITRKAANARELYECPVAFLLRLVEECNKAAARPAVSEDEKRSLNTGKQGFLQQLGADMVLLTRYMRTKLGSRALTTDLPLIGRCNPEQIAKAAENFSRESWELINSGATSLSAFGVEKATGACKKNIANALAEQRDQNVELIEALRTSACESYAKGGALAPATYREIGKDVPADFSSLQQTDCELAEECTSSQTPAGAEGTTDDTRLCVICSTEERSVLFEPCRHLSTCATCAAVCDVCPVCRGPITSTNRVSA